LRKTFPIVIVVGASTPYFFVSSDRTAYAQGRVIRMSVLSEKPEMSRIAPATPPFEPSVQEQLDKIMPPGMAPFSIFTTMARDPRIFAKMVGKALFGKGHITAREREIVVNRVTARCGAEYEWGVHVGVFADALGFTEEQIASSVHGDHVPRRARK
jgi:alkylhydroperoxidase/carboxymuconolactone decarboxylase family protein YurZ